MNVDFVTAVKMFFYNYANFKGRSTRAEYWWAILFLVIVNIVCGPILKAIVGQTASEVILGIWSLATIVPSLAIAWRRLHDVDKAGGWYFINLIPLLGNLYYLYLVVQPSGPDNRFGPDPYGAE